MEKGLLRANMLVDFVDGSEALDSSCSGLKEGGAGFGWLTWYFCVGVVGRHFCVLASSFRVERAI